jgi:hypothetical protein
MLRSYEGLRRLSAIVLHEVRVGGAVAQRAGWQALPMNAGVPWEAGLAAKSGLYHRGGSMRSFASTSGRPTPTATATASVTDARQRLQARYESVKCLPLHTGAG